VHTLLPRPVSHHRPSRRANCSPGLILAALGGHYVSGATTAARSATPPTGRASALVGAGLTACCGAMRQISASTPTPDCPDGLDQPSAAQLGRSPRAATSRADGVSGRSTRRQAHWSAIPMRPMPRTPACTGAVAFRSVFAFVVLQTCNKPHSAISEGPHETNGLNADVAFGPFMTPSRHSPD
jgi:hypothetical protein